MSAWLATASEDPLAKLLIQYLFLHHAESLLGLASGSIASGLFTLLGGELPNFISYAEGIVTAVKIGLDLAKIANDVTTIINSPFKSILDSSPLRARLNGGGSPWILIGTPGEQQATSLAVVLALDARLEAFIIGADTFVHRARQIGTNQIDWSDWSGVPTSINPGSISIAAVRDGAGKIQVFRVGSDDGIYQAAESSTSAGAPLSAWADLTGGHAAFRSSLLAILDGTNRVRVFALGTDNAVYNAAETAPGAATYGSWTQIGGAGDLGWAISAGLNSDGRLEVFRIALDNQLLHAAESAAGGAWNAWEQVGQVSDPAPGNIDVTTDSAGFLQVCSSASDGNVYVARQLRPGILLGPWIQLPRPPQGTGLIKYGADASGALQLFLIGSDRTLYHSTQEVPGETWSSWFPVTPGEIYQVLGSGIAVTVPFNTQEVYDVATARNWNGQLEAFVRGHQLAIIHVAHVVPLIDSPKIQASGIRLRMSVVSLESGKLRYANENSQFVDNPPEGQFNLADAVVASGSLPAVFPPIKLIKDNYVDGGIRDLLPIKAAIDAGANSVISIVAGQPILPPAESFDGANLFDIASRGIADILPNQLLQDHLNPPVPWPVPARAVQVTDLPVNHVVHGELAIEPGLIAIAIDYGYMRAYDDLDATPTPLNDNPGPALHQNTDAIIDLRLQIWNKEHQINGHRLPLEDITQGVMSAISGTPPPVAPTPSAGPLRDLRPMKWQLKALVDLRRSVLEGRIPPGVESWWLNWETHSWIPETLSPWLSFQGQADQIGAEAPPLGSDNRLIAEQSASVVAYIIFGGAKFFVSLPWKTFTWGNVFRVPDGALQFDQTSAANGTVVREDGGNITYVIFGGAKFAIPGLPWPGATPGTSAGAVAGVNVVPAGSLNAISDVPVDGTILAVVDGAENVQGFYVVWGGAKFPIPASVLADFNLSSQLGLLAAQFWQVPIALINQIPDIPRDGTVLKEIHGLDPYLIQFGTKKRVVGSRRFFDLGLFRPAVGTLWDHALDAFPDGGLA
jgi:hypothetical protein